MKNTEATLNQMLNHKADGGYCCKTCNYPTIRRYLPSGEVVWTHNPGWKASMKKTYGAH